MRPTLGTLMLISGLPIAKSFLQKMCFLERLEYRRVMDFVKRFYQKIFVAISLLLIRVYQFVFANLKFLSAIGINPFEILVLFESTNRNRSFGPQTLLKKSNVPRFPIVKNVKFFGLAGNISTDTSRTLSYAYQFDARFPTGKNHPVKLGRGPFIVKD